MTPTPPNAGEPVADSIALIVAELRLLMISAAHINASSFWLGVTSGIAVRLERLSAAPKPECTIVHSEDPSAPAYLALGAVKVTRERCG